MPHRHLFKCSIALCLAGIPVQLLPVVSQDLVQGVAGRQRHTNAEASIGTDYIAIDEVMLMVVIHMRSIPNHPG